MYQQDVTLAHAAIDQFRKSYEHLPQLMEYLESYYFRPGKTNWMLCERQGRYYGQINTNNYIEAWHRTLKVNFFQQRRVKRVDRVIYILTQQAIPFFQRKAVESDLGIGRLSKREKKVQEAHEKAFTHLQRKHRCGDQSNLVNPVSINDTSAFNVTSFSQPGKVYTIATVLGEGPFPMITECDCPNFTKTRALCKHIALVMIHLPGYEFQKKPKTRTMVEEALEDVDALQGEEPSTTGATDEAHPNQELGDILSEMVTLLSSVNYKGRIPSAGDLVEGLAVH